VVREGMGAGVRNDPKHCMHMNNNKIKIREKVMFVVRDSGPQPGSVPAWSPDFGLYIELVGELSYYINSSWLGVVMHAYNLRR
jgi:hypothetical protein